jgi:hypothetical protein
MSRTIGVTVAAVAALVAVVPAASAAGSVFASVAKPSIAAGGVLAGTHYGGSAIRGSRTANPTIGLVVQPSGSVSARAGLAVRCGKITWGPVFVRMKGKATGPSFSVSGHTRLGGRTLRISAQGSVDGANANGTVRVRGRGCRGWTAPFILRTESALGGAAAM